MASPPPTSQGRKPSFTVERQQIGPITHLRVRGAIDETFASKRLAEVLTGHVLIDLGRVERISSFGVRQWMELTQRLPLNALGMYLIHAPPVLVDQLNMVEGFAGIAQVLSVLAPYACEKCGEERVRVVNVRDAGAVLAAGGAPSFPCTTCGSQMQFADQADEYFSFIRQHPIDGLEPLVERYMGSLAGPRPTDRASYVKAVQDDLTFVHMASTLRPDLSVRRLATGLEGTVVYDFSGVASVDAGAGKKLGEVLHAAGATASVVLWRVPPAALAALQELEPAPKVALASLWLPCECRGCGSSLYQAITSADYLRAISSKTSDSRVCGVCGGPAQVPLIDGASKLLTEMPAAGVPYAQIQAFEPKFASQLLQAGSPTGNTPHTPTGAGDPHRPQPPPKAPGDHGAAEQNLHLLKHLGRGGMAEVFLARQVGLRGVEKYVTVKRVLPQFAQSQDFVEMLFAEARANARLTHPNVVQIFDVGSMNGVAHLTMEYVRGPDLKRVLITAKKAGTSVPVPHALRVIAETAAGLHYAHTFVDPLGHPHPVIHRDVSPHNILVSLDGAVKLSDFGIAKVNDGGEGTQPGTFKGKIHYSSPEQIRGLPLDARHDLFSLGIVLFEALTGFLPFKGENDVATLTAIAQNQTPDPRQAVPGLPDDVCALVAKALAKNPDDRFQSAGEFRETIEEVMARHGYRSSPVDVSHFVRDLLGERLKDFSPAASSDMSPPRTPSDPSFPMIRLQGSYTPSAPRRATDAEMPRVPVDDALPRTAVLGPHGSAPRLGGQPPAPPKDLTPHPSFRPAPPVPGATPHPNDVRPPPPEPSLPLVPSGPLPSAPAGVAAPLGDGLPKFSARRAPSRAAVIIVALLLAACTGLALTFAGSDGGAVEISSLRPGEELYVAGVRVDPATLQPMPGAPAMVIAVAVGGELKRMGTAKVGAVLDLQPLFEASPGDGQRAALSVKTAKPGCAVQLGGKPVGGPTPMATDVVAGKAQELKVLCPNQPEWVRTILAVPGQAIEITAGLEGAPGG